jgi:hypothetical protein
MAKVTAYWCIELNCTCPNCNEYVNLLNYCDFWDGRKLEIAENNTDRSRNIEVICPECDHEFEVDCHY